MKIIRTRVATYKSKKRVLLIFGYDIDLVQQIKDLPGRKWSKTKNCWHIPFQEDYLAFLNERFNNEIKFLPGENINNKYLLNHNENSKVSEGMSSTQLESLKERKNISKKIDIEIPKEFEEMLKLKRYSDNTIRSYRSHFIQFLQYYSNRDPKSITAKEIREYLLYLVDKKKVSTSYQNQAINAIQPVGLVN